MGTKSKWKNGILRFYNNAVVDENVVTTTAGGTLLGYGLSVLKDSSAATYVLGAPVKGVTKHIIVQTTFAATVRMSTVANQVRVAAPTTAVNSLTLNPGSSYPTNVSLRGVSTVLWAITGAGCAGSTLMSANNVLFSTACT
jgi:hypothetical protein